ncbi:hypothetical protein PLESTF_001193100 [Pleodorina starrii]|nr:hypothetical protein PLESTF_001193100 [Pleodorina starrii]
MSGDIIAATLDVRSSSNIGSRRLLAGDLGEATFSLRQGSIRLLEQGAEKERYYGTCSYGKTIWNPSNVAVVGPIQLDCKGKVPGLAFPLDFDAASKCGAAEQMYWNQAVESFGRQLAANDNKLRAVLQWPERRRIMTILPQEVTCPWYGLAETSCSKSTCFSYIHGKATSNVYTIFHELQHNHGLQHAGWMSAEYGDQTDPMGSSPEGSSGPHCHNAASNWRIGWATPMPGGDLTAASFTPNSNRLRFMIPASGRTDQNMVIVNLGLQSSSPGAASISYPKYFLSYRVRNKTYGGYDAGLSDSFHQKVLVHNYNGTITDRDVTTKTWLIASAGTINTGPRFDAFDPAFGARNIWTGPFVPYNAATGLGGGLRIKVVSVGDTSAEVEVCRMYSQTEGAPGSPDCMANMDRDW